jgi:hypothetical protein
MVNKINFWYNNFVFRELEANQEGPKLNGIYKLLEYMGDFTSFREKHEIYYQRTKLCYKLVRRLVYKRALKNKIYKQAYDLT